jgi:hypothetical protein
VRSEFQESKTIQKELRRELGQNNKLMAEVRVEVEAELRR